LRKIGFISSDPAHTARGYLPPEKHRFDSKSADPRNEYTPEFTFLATRPMGREMIAAVPKLPESHGRDWPAEETVSRQRDGTTLWQIEAQCDDHFILAWGRTRSQAWNAVARITERIQRIR